MDEYSAYISKLLKTKSYVKKYKRVVGGCFMSWLAVHFIITVS